MSEEQLKKDVSLCADDEEDMSCGNKAGENCIKCGKGFCWSHLIAVGSDFEGSVLEEGEYCRGCVVALIRELDEENIRLRGD